MTSFVLFLKCGSFPANRQDLFHWSLTGRRQDPAAILPMRILPLSLVDVQKLRFERER